MASASILLILMSGIVSGLYESIMYTSAPMPSRTPSGIIRGYPRNDPRMVDGLN